MKTVIDFLAKQEPVMALSVTIALVLAVAGVAVDANTVYTVLAIALPIIGGLIKRAKVFSPATVAEIQADYERVITELEKAAKGAN